MNEPFSIRFIQFFIAKIYNFIFVFYYFNSSSKPFICFSHSKRGLIGILFSSSKLMRRLIWPIGHLPFIHSMECSPIHLICVPAIPGNNLLNIRVNWPPPLFFPLAFNEFAPSFDPLFPSFVANQIFF